MVAIPTTVTTTETGVTHARPHQASAMLTVHVASAKTTTHAAGAEASTGAGASQ
jgi:hypothetical protein